MARHLAMIVCIACAPSAALAYCPGGDVSLLGDEPGYYAPPKEFARSQLVVEAVLERVTWLDADGKLTSQEPRSNLGTWYDLRVTRTFKGKHTGHVKLFSENSTARFEFDDGKPYLLFITDEKFDPPVEHALTIDTCGNSGLTEKNRKVLLQLNRLLGRKP